MNKSIVSDCEDCLHKVVCTTQRKQLEMLKDEVDVALKNLKRAYDDTVKVEIRCKHYQWRRIY